MFCEKCGAAAPDGVKFCPACGSSMAAQTVPEQQPTAQTGSAGFSPAPVKKRKKWWIGLLAAAGVLICAILLCVFVFPRDVQHLILGDEGYSKNLAKQSAVYLAENTAKAMASQDEKTLQGSVQITPIIEFGTFFEESGADKEQLKKMADYLNALKIHADLQKEKDNIRFEYRADDADGALLSMQGGIEKDCLTFRIPEIADSYIEMTADYSVLFGQNELDAQKLSQSLQALADTYVEALENAEYSYKKNARLKAHGIRAEADCAEIEFDGENAAELLISLLETARQDEYLEELFEQSFGRQAETDYQEMLGELIEELKDAKKELKNRDAKLKIAFYLNARNQCVGMEYSVTIDGSTASLKLIPGKGLASEKALSLEFDNEEVFYATWEGEKNTANGEIALNFSFFQAGSSENQFFGLRYQAENLKIVNYAGEKVLTGTADFQLYDPADLLANGLDSETAEQLKKAKLTVTAAADKDTCNTTIKLESETLGTFGFMTQETPQAQFSQVPAKTTENTYTSADGILSPAAEEELARGFTAWAESLQSRRSLNDAVPHVSEMLKALFTADPMEQLAGEWYTPMDISDYMNASFSLDVYLTMTEDGRMDMTIDADKLRSDYKEYVLNSLNELFTSQELQESGYASAEELLQEIAYQEGYFSADIYIRAQCRAIEEIFADQLISDSPFTCTEGEIVVNGSSIPYTLEEDLLNLGGIYFRRKAA